MHRHSTSLVATLLALVLGAASAIAQERSVTIGTGNVAGVYYPTGSAVCQLLNERSTRHAVRCTVAQTGGSVHNLNAMHAGKLDMGVVRSDWQFHAYNGTGAFADAGPSKELRSLFSLQSELLTVLARVDAGIERLVDLRGKRVGVDERDAGRHGAMEAVTRALGWTIDDFAFIAELEPDGQWRALCNDEVDAIVLTVGHPSASVEEATTSCDVVIVEASDPAIDRLVAENPYFHRAIIPAGMYRGTPADVNTVGLSVTLVTSTSTPEDIGYEVVKDVYEGLDDFRRQHPAFSRVTREEMFVGLSAPLHPGAEKFMKEAGLGCPSGTHPCSTGCCSN